MDAKEKAKEEEETRVFTITLVADFIKRMEKDHNDHRAEAKYYLEINGYNMQKAKDNYKLDVDYERAEQ